MFIMLINIQGFSSCENLHCHLPLKLMRERERDEVTPRTAEELAEAGRLADEAFFILKTASKKHAGHPSTLE